MIKFSRHAKRRMKLYDINENDVLAVINEGEREQLAAGKVRFLHELKGKFSHPLKVIGIEEKESLLIITAYPLKKGTQE
jgi:hypothetical protein